MPLRFPGGLNLKSTQAEWGTWLELNTVYLEAATFSRSELREQLDMYFPEENLLDDVVDGAFSEIEARAVWLGELYPLSYNRTHVERTAGSWRDCKVFAFLLALSVERYYDETRLWNAQWHEPARLFEYVTAAALARYIDGSALRIGSHREAPVPVPFNECLDFLGRETQEPAVGPANPQITDGDENCDVVAWRSFGDGRPAQMVILAQCAIGEGSWRSKIGDLNIDVWSDQIDWFVRPTLAFAFPFIPEASFKEWRYLSKNAGIPLDRLRLSMLARDEDLDAHVLARIADWCDGFVARLPYV